MRIRILCVGRIKDGPERDMLDDYLSRARKTGAGLGVRGVEEIEVADGGGREKEGERLMAKATATRIIRLDERGEQLSSEEFARRLTRWKDAGEDVDFLIGGADGHAPATVLAVKSVIALGPQTWPHRLVRVMLAEQVYRALSIAAGSPYHRA